MSQVITEQQFAIIFGKRGSMYPEDSELIESGHLDTGDGHQIYFERLGNPSGKPVVFLHGGPGGGISKKSRTFFDPAKYHVILFDQRGCGKSLPFASLENNTTWHLVADIERLRERFEISQWCVFGGSWGSTLALTYAITHPERVSELVLRGIYLSRRKEISWFYQEGASKFFPEAWETYQEQIDEDDRHEMVAAYYKKLTSPDEEERLKAARAWSQWEASTARLFYDPAAVANFEAPEIALPFARIECHYFINDGFFETADWIMENLEKISGIPGYIVQGRYDVICPPETAWKLHKGWENSQLTIIADEGHSAFETKIHDTLTTIMDKLGE